MKVFIAGATGVLGRRLVERLSDRGYAVVGLVRDDDGAGVVESRGGTARYGDVLKPGSLEAAVGDADVIVHAATSLPTGGRPSAADWERNDRVRLEGARNLVAAADGGIERFLFPSVVWVARQPDGSAFNEDSPRHPDRATQSAADVEDYLESAAEDHGFDVTVLRCGLFYAPDGATTRQFGRNLLAGRMPVLGGGLLGQREAELSLLHADDAARAFAAALDAGASGLYHVVDDERVTFSDYLTTFADLLDAPSPRRVPGWLGRLAVGKEAVTLFTTSIPTTSERFCTGVGWEPMYPTYREGLEQVVMTWQNNGTLQETANGYEWCGG